MHPEALAQKFLESLSENDFAPLFDTLENRIVKVIEKGRIERYNVLKRSEDIDRIIKRAVINVRDSHLKLNKDVKGVLYMLFRFDENGKKEPLYIGKTSRYGKNGKGLNSLFNSENNKPRWDYHKGGNYHLSGLSSLVCKGYKKKDMDLGKQNWAESMFKEYPSDAPKLNFIPYLWFKPWTTQDKSIIAEFGHVSLHLEELILIDVLSKTYPNILLNKADTES